MKTLILLLLAFIFVGCGGNSDQKIDSNDTNDTNVSTLRVQLDTRTLHPRTSTTPRLYLDEPQTIQEVTDAAQWISHDINTAYFDNGRIHAQRPGTARFTIRINEQEYNETLHVAEALPTTLQCSAQDPHPHVGTSTLIRCSALFDDNTSQEVTREISGTFYASVANQLDRDRCLHVNQKESVVLHARYLNRDTNLTIDLLESPLLALSLSQEELILHVGTQERLELYAHYADGWVQEISADANWSSLSPEVATIDAGSVHALAKGQSIIRANFGGFTQELPITVKQAELTRLELSAPQSPWPYFTYEQQSLGIERCVEAIAHYNDGSSRRVTQESLWRNTLEVNTLNRPGCFLTQKAPYAQIEAYFGGMMQNTRVELRPQLVHSFDLLAPKASLKPGFVVTLQPTITDTSANTYPLYGGVFMHTSNTRVATVDSTTPFLSGQLMAHHVGPVRIDAAYGPLRTSKTVQIEGAHLLRIVFDPIPPNTLPIGARSPLQAYGYFSDGSVQELSGALEYTISHPHVVHIDLNATQTTLKAMNAGTTTITARHGSVSASFDLNVTEPSLSALHLEIPSSTLQRSDEMQLEAVGIYSNGVRRNFNDVVTWSSYPTPIATVSSGGSLYGINVGTAVVTISYGSLSASATVEIIEPEITSILIQPDALEMDINQTVQLRAIAVYKDARRDDITSRVSWRSLYPQYASVDALGRVRGLKVGEAQIAAYYKGFEADQKLKVYKSPQAIVMVIPSLNMEINATMQLSCDLYYSDGSKSDVSDEAVWSSSNTTVATIDANATVLALAVGSTNIKVIYEGFERNQSISVIDPAP
ncbi:MAG: Ig-like domain-containing protein [Campylobacterales bacterium]|nr:Ig-like domain-containing protein [Campylobacterales bacterium]